MNFFVSIRLIRDRLLIAWGAAIAIVLIWEARQNDAAFASRLLRSQIRLEDAHAILRISFVGLLGAFFLWLSFRLFERQVAKFLACYAIWSDELTARRPDQTLPRLSENYTKLAEPTGAQESHKKLSAAISLVEFRYRQLLDERARTADALRGMQEGFVAVDNNLQLLLLNDAGRELLQMSGPIRVGKPLVELIRQPQILKMIQDAHVSGKASESVQQVGGGKGRLLRLRVSTLADWRSENQTPGDRYGILLMASDVTRLTKLESMRRDFTTNVSHELKTPLASIQAYAETLLIGAIDDPEANRRFVEGIAKQAERLSALIHDLLQLAKLDTEPDQVTLQPVGIDQIVDDVVAEQSPIAVSKGVQIKLQANELNCTVWGDREAIRTIVSNLISNAIRYNREEGEVFISFRDDTDWLTLIVQDTGVGISTEEHDRIFERFYRVDKARSIDVGGTGLGLAIVKHLVQQMGATISLESQLGRGSAFSVAFRPIRTQPAPLMSVEVAQ